MPTIEPEGEELRKATKWMSEERQYNPDQPLAKLIEAACLKFDLSPADAEFLMRHFKK